MTTIYSETHCEIGSWLEPTRMEESYAWWQYMRKVLRRDRVKVEMTHKVSAAGIKYTVLTFYFKKGKPQNV